MFSRASFNYFRNRTACATKNKKIRNKRNEEEKLKIRITVLYLSNIWTICKIQVQK